MSGVNRCSSPTGPKTHPKRIRRYGLWMGCMIMFGMIRSNKTKHTRTIMVSGYLRLRQGLVPGQPLLVAVSGCCGVVRKEGPSLLGPFGLPRWGGLPFLVSPGWGGELSSSSSSSSWEECASESSDDESDTTLRRRPFRVPAAFFLAFFSGAS